MQNPSSPVTISFADQLCRITQCDFGIFEMSHPQFFQNGWFWIAHEASDHQDRAQLATCSHEQREGHSRVWREADPLRSWPDAEPCVLVQVTGVNLAHFTLKGHEGSNLGTGRSQGQVAASASSCMGGLEGFIRFLCTLRLLQILL